MTHQHQARKRVPQACTAHRAHLGHPAAHLRAVSHARNQAPQPPAHPHRRRPVFVHAHAHAQQPSAGVQHQAFSDQQDGTLRQAASSPRHSASHALSHSRREARKPHRQAANPVSGPPGVKADDNFPAASRRAGRKEAPMVSPSQLLQSAPPEAPMRDATLVAEPGAAAADSHADNNRSSGILAASTSSSEPLLRAHRRRPALNNASSPDVPMLEASAPVPTDTPWSPSRDANHLLASAPEGSEAKHQSSGGHLSSEEGEEPAMPHADSARASPNEMAGLRGRAMHVVTKGSRGRQSAPAGNAQAGNACPEAAGSQSILNWVQLAADAAGPYADAPGARAGQAERKRRPRELQGLMPFAWDKYGLLTAIFLLGKIQSHSAIFPPA